MYNLKLRVMFYLVGILRASSLEDSLSDNSKGPLRRGKGEARIYRSFCNKDQVVGTSKDYC